MNTGSVTWRPRKASRVLARSAASRARRSAWVMAVDAETEVLPVDLVVAVPAPGVEHVRPAPRARIDRARPPPRSSSNPCGSCRGCARRSCRSCRHSEVGEHQAGRGPGGADHARHAGAGMSAGAYEIESADMWIAVMHAEERALGQQRLQGERRADVRVQLTLEVERCEDRGSSGFPRAGRACSAVPLRRGCAR